MSTTFDPNAEPGLLHLESPAESNGKLDALPSQLVTRAGFWRSTAPAVLKKGKQPAHEAWLIYWGERQPRATYGPASGAASEPLRWAPLVATPAPSTQKLLDLVAAAGKESEAAKFAKSKRNKELQAAVNDWLAAAKRAPADGQLALGALAAAHLLGTVGGALSADLGWKLVDFLTELARRAQAWNPDASDDALVAQQQLAGELPLTLSYVLDEMKPLHALRAPARETLSEALVELHNGEGLPRGANRAALRPLLACWTRCAAIAADDKQRPFNSKALRQYRHLVRQALRWTSPAGAELLRPESDAWQPEFLQAALRLGGKKKDVTAARTLLGKQLIGKDLDHADKTPHAPYHCDWARLALLRSGWSAADAVVAVDYTGDRVELEAWAEGRRLLSGLWKTESRIDGVPVAATDEWEETCWFSDRDVDYLELTQILDDGVRIDRQIMLARRDQFLYLCDHFYGGQEATLEHAWQLPLGPAVLFCGEGETRDALLVDGKPLARVMPLALPEWRIDPRVGELTGDGNTLTLSQKVVGRSVACPIFIDLNAERSTNASTWRQLTVAEALEIKSTDVAVSYRVQAGADQWVFYRSQGPRGNRTFMGQNTSSECYIARFAAPSGEVEELMEIEG
ncbi:hypothetical protein [Lacipirellula limnantheis]|uniref:Heparinase II/III-like protein n=1 Tax=Lacipirellula limnantheis TaxID=2528024 RepID=A0A517TXL1_9BACT|nr:hypothetical protein [Lacipirellula limnantheis]QDT73096.1 hypothetical protein I41_22850 [Lacipirellula limnantheis]